MCLSAWPAGMGVRELGGATEEWNEEITIGVMLTVEVLK